MNDLNQKSTQEDQASARLAANLRFASLAPIVLLLGVTAGCSPNSTSPTAPRIEARAETTVTATSIRTSIPTGVVSGNVIAVDPNARSLLLDTAHVIYVNNSTEWDSKGNLSSFRQLSSAFDGGVAIRLKAYGQINRSGEMKANRIKANGS